MHTSTPHGDSAPRPGTHRAQPRARHVGRARTGGLTWADLGLSPDDLAWHERAACRETDPDAFFPDEHGQMLHLSVARRVCRACPVQAECRDYALARPALVGVWGGLTVNERIRLRRTLGSTEQETA